MRVATFFFLFRVLLLDTSMLQNTTSPFSLYCIGCKNSRPQISLDQKNVLPTIGPEQTSFLCPSLMLQVNLSTSEVQALIDWLALQPNLSLSLASALAHLVDSLAVEGDSPAVLKI